MASFADQVVVINGASSGIGAALARELDRRGARLVLAARRLDLLEDIAADCAHAITVSVDLTEPNGAHFVLAEALDAYNSVDVWVNNVGRGITRSVLELTDDDVSTMMRDNLLTALYGMQTSVRHFQNAGSAGVVVNMSSLLAHLPQSPIRSAYSASKAGLNALTETLRAELRASGSPIRLVLVMPGAVATDFGTNCVGGGPPSAEIPGVQSVAEVIPRIADGILAGPLDMYLGPDDLDRIVDALRSSAQQDA